MMPVDSSTSRSNSPPASEVIGPPSNARSDFPAGVLVKKQPRLGTLCHRETSVFVRKSDLFNHTYAESGGLVLLFSEKCGLADR